MPSHVGFSHTVRTFLHVGWFREPFNLCLRHEGGIQGSRDLLVKERDSEGNVVKNAGFIERPHIDRDTCGVCLSIYRL